ncbi:hypothetical protein R6Z07M_017097 [Ovis aries]
MVNGHHKSQLLHRKHFELLLRHTQGPTGQAWGLHGPVSRKLRAGVDIDTQGQSQRHGVSARRGGEAPDQPGGPRTINKPEGQRLAGLARPPAPGDARALLTFNYEAAVRHHAFGVRGQQSAESGGRRVSPAAAADAPSDSLGPAPAQRPARVHRRPRFPALRLRPAPYRAQSHAPCAAAARAPPLRRPSRGRVSACATRRAGADYVSRQAVRAAARAGREGSLLSPPSGRGLRFPSGRASRRRRRPRGLPRTPLPGAPREAAGRRAEGGPTRAART